MSEERGNSVSKKNFGSKLDKYSIKNLPIIIVSFFLFGYFFYYLSPDFYAKLILSPYHVVEYNEYWRLLTWVFTVPMVPEYAIEIIFIPIMLFFYYYVSKKLELVWGTGMFNLYVLSSVVLIDVAVVLTGFIKLKWTTPDMMDAFNDIIYSSTECIKINYYTTLSLFLAFAVIFGEEYVNLYMFIPLKVKWLGYFDFIYLIYLFVKDKSIYGRIIIVAAVMNFFVFLWVNRRKKVVSSVLQKKRAASYRHKINMGYKMNERNVQRPRPDVKKDNKKADPNLHKVIKLEQYGGRSSSGGPIHKCCICGRTENDDENLEFRFCSKCNGNYEYCSDHIFTHEHKK